MKRITERLKMLKGRDTLRKFSDRVGIGQSTLHNYLHGRDIKASFIRQICLQTGCNANWLLGIDTDKKNSGIVTAAIGMHIAAQHRETKELLKGFGIPLCE